MPRELSLSVGQYSDKGRKETNQDFHGVLIPGEPLLSMKGIAVVLTDGISSSDVSRVASESAVKSFLTDYYCTSETWSVKTSAQRVIAATNSWLHAQTRRGRHPYDSDKGYVCTLSAIVFKSTTAHIFHIGDCRVYRVAGNTLEQLTDDHRVVISSAESYLGRALGVNPRIEIDYTPGTRHPERARITGTDGEGKPVVVEVETRTNVVLHVGGGYGGDPDWTHGQWKGENFVERVTYDLTSEAVVNRTPFGVIDHCARATCDGETGHGLFEHASFGRHDPTGFVDWSNDRH